MINPFGTGIIRILVHGINMWMHNMTKRDNNDQKVEMKQSYPSAKILII